MSLTSKPLMSSMNETMFLPMSCRSPCTLPIRTLPSFFGPSPGPERMSGLATRPMVSSISPAITNSGRKYSPASNRLPTMSIAARQRSSTRAGLAPSSSSIRLARASASSSSMSASQSTSWRSCSLISLTDLSPSQARLRRSGADPVLYQVFTLLRLVTKCDQERVGEFSISPYAGMALTRITRPLFQLAKSDQARVGVGRGRRGSGRGRRRACGARRPAPRRSPS